MASAASRFHIVLSPDERRAWTGNAAKLGVPTSEYVRRAVASYNAGANDDELERLAGLADEAAAASARMSAMIDHAVAAVDRPIDEAGIRARADAEAALWDFDSAVLDFRPDRRAAPAA